MFLLLNIVLSFQKGVISQDCPHSLCALEKVLFIFHIQYKLIWTLLKVEFLKGKPGGKLPINFQQIVNKFKFQKQLKFL